MLGLQPELRTSIADMQTPRGEQAWLPSAALPSQILPGEPSEVKGKDVDMVSGSETLKMGTKGSSGRRKKAKTPR